MAKDFWPRNYIADGSSHARAIPAPVDSIYRPAPIEHVHAEFDTRARQYAYDVNNYVKGNLSKDQLFRAFNAPVYGAYGEKL